MNQVKENWPVTRTEMKEHLGLPKEYKVEDTYIDETIKDATEFVEGKLGYEIAYTKNTLYFDNFSGSEITIKKGNFSSLVGVYDSSDVSIAYQSPVIVPNLIIPDEFTIKFNSVQTTNPLKIVYYTGWSTANVKQVFKRMVKIKCTDLVATEKGNWATSNYKDLQTLEGFLEDWRLWI